MMNSGIRCLFNTIKSNNSADCVGASTRNKCQGEINSQFGDNYFIEIDADACLLQAGEESVVVSVSLLLEVIIIHLCGVFLNRLCFELKLS